MVYVMPIQSHKRSSYDGNFYVITRSTLWWTSAEGRKFSIGKNMHIILLKVLDRAIKQLEKSHIDRS